jgi:carboxymethylenebutenolidase
MCHDHDSRPPAPPRIGDVAERGVLTLTSADGTEFSAAYAAPAEAARVGVVVLPDIRGLHPYYVALAERFAEAGAATVAIDYFGRTAGVCDESGTRPEDFDWKSHIPQTTEDGIDGDITAAVAYLRSRTRDDLPVVTVGFCFGGSHSWRQSGGQLDLAGCAGFYGRPAMVGDAAGRAHLPTVMLIAGADAATPVADQLQLADTMRAAGAEVDAVVYDGAPHSFFDRAFGEWAEACRDAWEHVLALTDRVAAR